MKIVVAVIEGDIVLPQSNEPYKRELVFIHRITHYYEDGSHDSYLNSLFGNIVEPEFYQILPSDCEVVLDFERKVRSDDYYAGNEFKRACYNRGFENPYQLPKWTTL